MRIPINKQLVLSRISEILKDVNKLSRFKEMKLSEFIQGENFAIAEHYLRRALEAVFDIGNHILSRLPEGRAYSYKEIAVKLGESGIVSREFAEKKLIKMAGYRNRLTHFYSEVTSEEMYYIILKNLDDFIEFINFVKIVLENPEKFNLKAD